MEHPAQIIEDAALQLRRAAIQSVKSVQDAYPAKCHPPLSLLPPDLREVVEQSEIYRQRYLSRYKK